MGPVTHGALGVGVEVLEGPWDDPSPFDEGIDLVSLEADHTAHLVGRHLAFVDETVESAQSDPQPGARLRSPNPFDGFCHGWPILQSFAVIACFSVSFTDFASKLTGCPRRQAIARRYPGPDRNNTLFGNACNQ